MNKRRKLDLESVFEEMKNTQFEKKKIYGENLELDYYRVFSKSTAADIFRQLEGSLEYLDAESSQVRILFCNMDKLTFEGDPGRRRRSQCKTECFKSGSTQGGSRKCTNKKDASDDIIKAVVKIDFCVFEFCTYRFKTLSISGDNF